MKQTGDSDVCRMFMKGRDREGWAYAILTYRARHPILNRVGISSIRRPSGGPANNSLAVMCLKCVRVFAEVWMRGFLVKDDNSGAAAYRSRLVDAPPVESDWFGVPR